MSKLGALVGPAETHLKPRMILTHTHTHTPAHTVLSTFAVVFQKRKHGMVSKRGQEDDNHGLVIVSETPEDSWAMRSSAVPKETTRGFFKEAGTWWDRLGQGYL